MPCNYPPVPVPPKFYSFKEPQRLSRLFLPLRNLKLREVKKTCLRSHTIQEQDLESGDDFALGDWVYWFLGFFFEKPFSVV